MNALEPVEHVAPPEYILWLAVIERAIMDYVQPPLDFRISGRKNLHWFLFSKPAYPHNLRYVCELLFNDPTVADTIAKRVKAVRNGDLPLSVLKTQPYSVFKPRQSTSTLVNDAPSLTSSVDDGTGNDGLRRLQK